MMESNEQIRADLDEDMAYAIAALVGAEGSDLRRTLRLALATLYAWANFEKKQDGRRAHDEPAGRALADLVSIRAFAEHIATATPGIIARDGIPADDRIPGDDRIPAAEPWFDPDVIVRPPRREQLAAFGRLRGKRIIPELQAAVAYLRSRAL
ncbi:hypothetical protein J2Y69_002298 [Microbacterium resistens]|uniref:Uncharacterized protein n=1 Tax=Microbacterium resistens TaxID=156977 RepID=A0ABU1SDP8_9MICO|nr:hypothetical protein [Microbacterium resistens]MDR6867694.1 hypothetical protein [Microbacterium resistens]